MAASSAAQGVSSIGRVPYTGKLEQNGVKVSGDVKMVFTIYDGEDAQASALWTETHDPVSVRAGNFNVDLGASVDLPAVLFTHAELYLEIAVNDVVMSGRKRILMVPFAVRAALADKATTADNIRDAQNYCLVVKSGDACPAGFTVSQGTTDFRHNHSGNTEHRHDLLVDGAIEGAGSTAENCRLGIHGEGWFDNIVCDDWAGGATVKTRPVGSGISQEGGGQAWQVCCNY